MKDENKENKVTEPAVQPDESGQLPEETTELLEELEDTTEFDLEAILEEYVGQPEPEESAEEPEPVETVAEEAAVPDEEGAAAPESVEESEPEAEPEEGAETPEEPEETAQTAGSSMTRSAPHKSAISALQYLSMMAGAPLWTKSPLMAMTTKSAFVFRFNSAIW